MITMTTSLIETTDTTSPEATPDRPPEREQPDGLFTWIVVSFMAAVLLGNMPPFSLWAADVTGQGALQSGLLVLLGVSVGFGLLFWLLDRAKTR